MIVPARFERSSRKYVTVLNWALDWPTCSASAAKSKWYPNVLVLMK